MAAIIQNNRKIYQVPSITYPAGYEIHILGKLDPSWSDRLAGMSITTTGGKNVTSFTTLKGELSDQSALLGVLNTLHDLGYELLHVDYIYQKGPSDEEGT